MADEMSPNSLPAPSFMSNNPLQPATPFSPAPAVGKEKAAEAQRFAYAPDQAKQGLDIGVARRTEEAQRAYKVMQNQQTQAIVEESKRVDQQIAAEEAQIAQARGEIESIRQQIAQAQAAAAEAQRKAAELQSQAARTPATSSQPVTGFNVDRARALDQLPEFQQRTQEAYNANVAQSRQNYDYFQSIQDPRYRGMSFDQFLQSTGSPYTSDYVQRTVEAKRQALMNG